MEPQVPHSGAPALETQQFNTVCEILRRNHNDPARLIPILQQVQKEYRYLPEEVLTFIATPLRLRPAQVFGVATFYSHFSLRAAREVHDSAL